MYDFCQRISKQQFATYKLIYWQLFPKRKTHYHPQSQLFLK